MNDMRTAMLNGLAKNNNSVSQDLVMAALKRDRVQRAGSIEGAAKKAGCAFVAVYDDRNPSGHPPLRASAQRIPARLWGGALISQINLAIQVGNWEIDGPVLAVHLVHEEHQQVQALVDGLVFA